VRINARLLGVRLVPTKQRRFTALALLIGLFGSTEIAGAAPAWRTTVQAFAAKNFRHSAWGYAHSTRDYSLALELAAADHKTLDDDVLFAAAYLHDMAAFAPWEKQGVDHADEAARIVDSVLKGTDFPMARLDAVRAAIRTHMYDREPLSPEALYLHDADALDWLGAIGIARILALVGTNEAPDLPAAIKMIKDNLAQVPSRVLSPAGRARLPARTAEVQEFLKDLGRESDGMRSL
jgi:HD superfamily phosphodiesterase